MATPPVTLDAVQGFGMVGGIRVVTQGASSITRVQGSYPQCRVRVYASGTTGLSPIFDALGNPLPNPFTANTDGSWLFYAGNGVPIDVVMDGGIPVPMSQPFTLTGIIPGGRVSGGTGGGAAGTQNEVQINNGGFLGAAYSTFIGNDANVPGTLTTGTVRVTQDVGPGPPDSAQIVYNHTSNNVTFEGTGPDVATVAGVLLTGWNSDHSESINYLICEPTGNTMPVPLAVNADITSTGEITGGVVRATKSGIAEAQPQIAYLEFVHPLNQARVVATGPDPATVGGMRLDGESSDYSIGINYLDCNAGLITVNQPLTFVQGITGDVNFTGDITAPTANFTDCLVDQSPVRTFANTPGGPGQGMVWPDIGIAVSQGDTWQSPSIDPAILARTNINNMFTDAQSLMHNSLGSFTTPSAGGISLTWNISNATGEVDFINHTPTGGGFSWYSVIGGGTITPATPRAMYLDTGTNLHVPGGIRAFGPMSSSLNNGTSQVTIGTFSGGLPAIVMENQGAAANAKIWDFTTDSAGNLLARAIDDAYDASNVWMQVTRSGNTPGAINFNVPVSINSAVTVNSPVTGTTSPFLSEQPNLAVGSTTSLFVGQSNTTNNMVYYGFQYGGSPAANRGIFGWAGGNTVATFDSAGNWVITGDLTTNSGFVRLGGQGANVVGDSGGNVLVNPTGAGAVRLNWNGGATGGVVFGNGASGSVGSINNAGTLQLSGNVAAVNGYLSGSLSVTTAANHGQVNLGPCNIFSDGNIQINAATGGNVLLNWTGNGAGISFGNGAGGSVGGVTAAGVLTAITKSFKITHPLDSTKHLTHSCIEGPEIAVYYRGEGQTDANGLATITLPDYFEALTLPTGRSVLLTEIFEDDDTELGKLAASRVKDGQFRVRSEFASQKFYWEVKAVRADVDALEVITEKNKDNENISTSK